MLAKDLCPYEKNKDKLLKKTSRTRRGFKEALVEIVENPKVKWGKRGQDEDEDEDEDEEDSSEDDKSDSDNQVSETATKKVQQVQYKTSRR